MTTYHITCNCNYQGGFEAFTHAEALDAWALDAGYKSYAEMCERLEKDPVDLRGIEISQYHGRYRANCTVGPDYADVYVDSDGTLTVGDDSVQLDTHELEHAFELLENDDVMRLAHIFDEKRRAIWG